MKILSKILFTLFIFSFFNTVSLLSQSFEKNILIDIPGDNYDFDLLAIDTYPGAESFITWINKNDSTYTVYLKKISPEISDTNIVISSNNDMKSNPKVAVNRYAPGIKIVWQNYSNNYFQIVGCNYFNDSLSNKTIIKDSLATNPSISLSTHRIAWINDNKLFIREFYPSISNPILVDSLNCTSPNIIKDDAITSTQILYERIENEKHKIYLAEFNDYLNPKWTYNLISDGNNTNSNFGIGGGVSFETIENEISKIRYTDYGTEYFNITENTSCNYKNPNVFSYPVPTSSTNNKTPFFVAFDSDSLESNNEIFIKTFYYGLYDSLINISKMEGNDYKPKVAYIVNDDTVYIAIIWLHQNNSKTDIWIAKEVFNPIYTSIKDENININSFDLFQNYPNPFNPTTTITYSIPTSGFVTLKIYNLLGSEIATLVNEEKNFGTYKVTWDAQNIPSGVYFYKITASAFSIVKKMILLK
jgi:Secretion system C-terminal sorting domain